MLKLPVAAGSLLLPIFLTACLCPPLTITPSNAVAGSCQPIQLKTQPSYADVVWSVEGIMGGNSEVGTINNGFYFPPNAATARNINISARAPNGGQANTTLVLDPLVGTPGALSVAGFNKIGMPLQQASILESNMANIVAGQIVVKFHEQNKQPSIGLESVLKAVPLSTELKPLQSFNGTVLLGANLNEAQTIALAREISLRPDVLLAEPNRRLQKFSTPKDVAFHCQWNTRAPQNSVGTKNLGSINLPAAWEKTTGSSNTVVAVLDTGILWRNDDASVTHPELSGRVLPGFDFVSGASAGNDNQKFSDNWQDVDADPYDNSDMEAHGTHVAGIIAGNSNNEIGIASINWNAKILPLRVLGVNDATSFDAINGLYWAVGYKLYTTIYVARGTMGATECNPVITNYQCLEEFLPVNPNPSKILNLSFGTPNTLCSVFWQKAINDVRTKGANVVVAAGNGSFAGNINVGKIEPANCAGAIAVGATESNGARANYSVAGPRIDVMAPGGGNDRGGLPGGILGPSKLTDGSFGYSEFTGTSLSAAHVSGVLSLMLGLRPTLLPGEALDILKQSSHSMTASLCDNGAGRNLVAQDCGAGLIDARAALDLTTAAKPGFGISLNQGVVSISPGESASFNFSFETWNGFSGAITPVVSGLPTGVTANLVQNQDGTWSITLTADPSSARYDAIPIVITASAAGQPDRQAVISLTVAALQ